MITLDPISGIIVSLLYIIGGIILLALAVKWDADDN